VRERSASAAAGPVPAGAVELRRRARRMAAGRAVLGAAVLVAPRRMARLFGFPAVHDNPAAVYFGRLYAVRELAMGLHLLREATLGQPTVTTVAANTAVDAVDAVMSWLVVAVRRDMGRGPLTVALFASLVTAQWAALLRRLGRVGHH
jgi:hypothetical protein